jgi:hypothetical protein
MTTLADHERYLDFATSVRRWEGVKSHFYGDSRGLVTLGIGHIFDEGNRVITAGMQLEYGVVQANRASMLYGWNAAEARNEWRRVKQMVIERLPGSISGVVSAGEYATVTRLRITESTALQGLRDKVRTLQRPIYDSHPELERLDIRIGMAVLDVRFNPGGIQVLGSDFAPVWSRVNAALSLPAGSPQVVEAAQAAYDAFCRLVSPISPDDSRQRRRYKNRHHQRVQRMREGLDATFGVRVVPSPSDETWSYDP